MIDRMDINPQFKHISLSFCNSHYSITQMSSILIRLFLSTAIISSISLSPNEDGVNSVDWILRHAKVEAANVVHAKPYPGSVDSYSLLDTYGDPLNDLTRSHKHCNKLMNTVHANLSSGDQGSMAICQELLQRTSMLKESLHTEMARGELALTMEAALRGQEMVSEAFDYQTTCLEVLEEDSASKTTNKELLQLLLSASSTECSTKLSVARMLKRLVNKTPTKVRVQQAKIVLFADMPLRRTITVALDGSGDYKSITDAIGSVSTGTGAQDDDDGYIIINHNKPRIMLVGAGINRTKLSSNRSNQGGRSTYQSATLINEADGLIALDFTVENTAVYGWSYAIRN